MLHATLRKNDRLAYQLIGVVSFVVFAAIVVLSKFKWEVDLGFNPHFFASLNAVINSTVSVLLVVAFVLVRQKKYAAHKNVMLAAMVLSVIFLVSYIAHHLFAGETRYGGGGPLKVFYLVILASHIILAGIILPFILLTAYRSLSGEFGKHKKIARYTFPLWLYVSVTGVLVYLLISPYYK